MSFLELRDGNRRILGTGGFLTAIAVIVGWFALEFWLQGRLGWPEAYGYPCHLSRNCWVQSLWNSPALLRHGGIWDDLFFVILWTPQASLLSSILFHRLRKRRSSSAIMPLSSRSPE